MQKKPAGATQGEYMYDYDPDIERAFRVHVADNAQTLEYAVGM